MNIQRMIRIFAGAFVLFPWRSERRPARCSPAPTGYGSPPSSAPTCFRAGSRDFCPLETILKRVGVPEAWLVGA